MAQKFTFMIVRETYAQSEKRKLYKLCQVSPLNHVIPNSYKDVIQVEKF